MIAGFLTIIVRLYQIVISPLTPAACRHLPTCSEYTIEALKTRNFLTAIYLSAHRILRCNPWGSSGFDPVPTKEISKK